MASQVQLFDDELLEKIEEEADACSEIDFTIYLSTLNRYKYSVNFEKGSIKLEVQGEGYKLNGVRDDFFSEPKIKEDNLKDKTDNEVKDEKTSEKASEALNNKILSAEGLRLLEKIRDNDFVVALVIDGNKTCSYGFAENISKWLCTLRGRLCFVIGGSIGLSKDVIKRADYKLSFSDMTFPHQLMRVILAEQIYRAFRIINNEPYHK